MTRYINNILLLLFLLAGIHTTFAQAPGSMPVAPQRDTSMNKSNTAKWKEENANVVYEKLNSAKKYYQDTSIHTFQRAPFTQPWYRDLGNLGSSAYNLLFTPYDHIGPSLGYHVYDIYRFNPDSLYYYNTKRAYSVFNYLLGSKLEQTVGLLHTQNIRPNWNFAAEYHKTNSPGFFKTERTNNDNACLSTNYKSFNKHYVLYAGFVYNKEQQDENGGIVHDSDLVDSRYDDRRTMNTAYQNSAYSITRSPVTNTLRDFGFLVQHSYMWGRTDTTYNADSTQSSYHLVPRFGLTHRMELSTEKHTYNDLTPDSFRYVTLFHQAFANSGGQYVAGSDSVLNQQKWFWIDNQILLNGFIGKAGSQLKFSAGAGTRFDNFVSLPIAVPHVDSNGNPYTTRSFDKLQIVNNYLTGNITKEALHPGEWEYGVNGKFFITGDYAGDFLFNALLGKQLKNDIGSFVAGFGERVSSPEYSYTHYENYYTRLFFNFNKESTTNIFATLESSRLKLSGGYRNYVIGNYIYISQAEVPAQYTGTFSISQLWAKKVFRLGSVYLDNELVLQQVPDNAPVNAPPLMGRHQLSFEKALFKRRLKLAAGAEVRYNTAYHPAGYDPLLNKFYYQTARKVSNAPEAALFVNFRIKRFRAFVMGDNLQMIGSKKNTILFMGTPVINYSVTGLNYLPSYAAPDALIRFGFSWVLVN